MRIRQQALRGSLEILYINPEDIAYGGIQSFVTRLPSSYASLLSNQGASLKGIHARVGHSDVAITDDP